MSNPTIPQTRLDWLGRHPWLDRVLFIGLGVFASLMVRSGVENLDAIHKAHVDATNQAQAALHQEIGRLLPKGKHVKEEGHVTMPDCVPAHPPPE